MTIFTPFLNSIRALLADASDEYNMRARLFDIAIAMSRMDRDEVVAPSPLESIPTTGRFRLVDPGSLNMNRNAREYYFIDGRLTASKIYAIKFLYSKESMGLKDAKDYIEGLPALHVENGELR